MASEITSIRSFLVRPGKGKDLDDPIGTDVPLTGKIFKLLKNIFDTTEKDCDISIRFCSTTKQQDNEFRDRLIEYIEAEDADLAAAIAQKVASNLQNVTTGASGLGLLFLINGSANNKNKLVISRFRADEGITASETSDKLEIEFLEQIFMKNMHTYKAVAYANLTSTSGVWDGSAVDRQITNLNNPTSKYWIEDFLQSEFAVTPKLGSERVAFAFQEVMNGKFPEAVKTEVSAAATLLKNYSGGVTTIEKLFGQLKVSPDTLSALNDSVRNQNSLKETFQFDFDAFANVYKYKAVTLHTGVTIIAGASEFDDHVKSSMDGEVVKFETQGKIVAEKIKKVKSGGAF